MADLKETYTLEDIQKLQDVFVECLNILNEIVIGAFTKYCPEMLNLDYWKGLPAVAWGIKEVGWLSVSNPKGQAEGSLVTERTSVPFYDITIWISSTLLDDPKCLKSTMLHELCHAAVGQIYYTELTQIVSHDGVWGMFAEYYNLYLRKPGEYPITNLYDREYLENFIARDTII